MNTPPTPAPYQPPTPQPAAATPPAPVVQPAFVRTSIPDGPPPTPNPQLPNNAEPKTPSTPALASPPLVAPAQQPASNLNQRHKVTLMQLIKIVHLQSLKCKK